MIKENTFSINALKDKETAQKMDKIINPYGYGQGYDLKDMQADMLNNVEYVENYWLAQIWDELIDAEFVQPIFGEGNEVYHIIGFESKEEIQELRNTFA